MKRGCVLFTHAPHILWIGIFAKWWFRCSVYKINRDFSLRNILPKRSNKINDHINRLSVIYVGLKFPDIFVQVFKIVVDSGKFSMLLIYIVWDDWLIFFLIPVSNEQLLQEFEYTLLKPDCHSWWISKRLFGREDTLEDRYAIKLCFKLGKMPQKCMECFGQLLEHLAWIEYKFLSGIRDSRKAGSLGRMMRSVGGVKKSIHQSWLAKGLGLGVLCWGFKGVQEEILREEASTLQIGSVAFPLGQCTIPQLHPCHRLFGQDGHQNNSSASL